MQPFTLLIKQVPEAQRGVLHSSVQMNSREGSAGSFIYTHKYPTLVQGAYLLCTEATANTENVHC